LQFPIFSAALSIFVHLPAAAHRPEFLAGSQGAVMDAAAWVSREFEKAAHF